MTNDIAKEIFGEHTKEVMDKTGISAVGDPATMLILMDIAKTAEKLLQARFAASRTFRVKVGMDDESAEELIEAVLNDVADKTGEEFRRREATVDSYIEEGFDEEAAMLLERLKRKEKSDETD